MIIQAFLNDNRNPKEIATRLKVNKTTIGREISKLKINKECALSKCS